jgi:hypothetical protein
MKVSAMDDAKFHFMPLRVVPLLDGALHAMNDGA